MRRRRKAGAVLVIAGVAMLALVGVSASAGDVRGVVIGALLAAALAVAVLATRRRPVAEPLPPLPEEPGAAAAPAPALAPTPVDEPLPPDLLRLPTGADAADQQGGTDSPMVEDWTWDRLVLPTGIKARLQQLVATVAEPGAAPRLGDDPPTGLLLTGPPGTGKTTVARVLAAQAGYSFHPITGTEGSIAGVFHRAGEDRPSLVFLDDLDDRRLTELLGEIDGVASQPGVFVLAATNRPDQLDPALLRAGRLSRTIEIPLPDFKGRIALLRLFTSGLPLDRVDVDLVARRTAGLSGADLEALCQRAAAEAATRSSPVVAAADFDAAVAVRVMEPPRA